MDKDYGRSPKGAGHSAEPEPVVSALRASVPNAIEVHGKDWSVTYGKPMPFPPVGEE